MSEDSKPSLESLSQSLASVKFESADNVPVVQSPVVETRKPRVVIGTPCYGGMAYTNYFVSLMHTLKMMEANGIDCYPIFIQGESLITRGRNNIVAKFLNDPLATHLIFIDADIAWNPIDVLKLLQHNKDIVGGIYPMKTYKFENLDFKNLSDIIERNKGSLHSSIPTPEFIRQNLMKYNLNHKHAQFKVEKNLVEVKHIANGFMMIKREVLEKMIEAHPEFKFWDDMGCLNKEEDRFAYTLFDCKVVDGHYFSEDWLFCHRWEEMGGSIYTDITINLTHIGTHHFQGRFLSSLNIKQN